jgi:hypothetical protein
MRSFWLFFRLQKELLAFYVAGLVQRRFWHCRPLAHPTLLTLLLARPNIRARNRQRPRTTVSQAARTGTEKSYRRDRDLGVTADRSTLIIDHKP